MTLSKNIIDMAKNVNLAFPTPLPSKCSPPNMEHLNDWAESQVTPMLRAIALKIVNQIKYISFEAFLVRFKKTIDDFHQKTKDEPYVLLIGEERGNKLNKGCSDSWMVGLAFEHCGLREPEAMITLSELEQYFSRKNIESRAVLLLDDAAYSGVQKNMVIYELSQYIPENFSLYVGIPFLTSYAKNCFEKHRERFGAMYILEHDMMLSSDSALNVEERFYVCKTNIEIDNKHALTYFDHRFADVLSCFQPVYTGSPVYTQHAHLMFFSGYTRSKDASEKNKYLSLINDVNTYEDLLFTLFAPNSRSSREGYNIPKIITPYKLSQPKVDLPIGQQQELPVYAKPAASLEIQIAFDRSVMLGHLGYITYHEQAETQEKKQQVNNELMATFGM